MTIQTRRNAFLLKRQKCGNVVSSWTKKGLLFISSSLSLVRIQWILYNQIRIFSKRFLNSVSVRDRIKKNSHKNFIDATVNSTEYHRSDRIYLNWFDGWYDMVHWLMWSTLNCRTVSCPQSVYFHFYLHLRQVNRYRTETIFNSSTFSAAVADDDDDDDVEFTLEEVNRNQNYLNDDHKYYERRPNMSKARYRWMGNCRNEIPQFGVSLVLCCVMISGLLHAVCAGEEWMNFEYTTHTHTRCISHYLNIIQSTWTQTDWLCSIATTRMLIKTKMICKLTSLVIL